ncbi:hypothetical protein ACFLVX_04465 [Chloroflexota bacterium]
MKRLSVLVLVFAIAFAVFLVGPPFLGKPFTPYPLMNVADVFDILTPLVLVPLYWLLYRMGQPKPLNISGMVIFCIFAAFCAQGQGMHLSANSIDHLLKGMETSDIYGLTHFYDEVLSHYLRDIGIVGLSALLILRSWQNLFTEQRATLWPPILAGVIHGFAFFLVIIESGTAPLGVTGAILATLFGLIWGRKGISQRPVAAFFLMSYTVATVFFIGWGIYWRGLPQFSEVGLI